MPHTVKHHTAAIVLSFFVVGIHTISSVMYKQLNAVTARLSHIIRILF